MIQHRSYGTARLLMPVVFGMAAVAYVGAIDQAGSKPPAAPKATMAPKAAPAARQESRVRRLPYARKDGTQRAGGR
jgi:hypothetical protein